MSDELKPVGLCVPGEKPPPDWPRANLAETKTSETDSRLNILYGICPPQNYSHLSHDFYMLARRAMTLLREEWRARIRRAENVVFDQRSLYRCGVPILQRVTPVLRLLTFALMTLQRRMLPRKVQDSTSLVMSCTEVQSETSGHGRNSIYSLYLHA